MKSQNARIFRPTAKPAASLPMGARSTGCYFFDSDVKVDWGPRQIIELYWTFSGCGAFRFGKREYLLEPEFVCMHFPGDEHIIRTKRALWECHWLTVDGPLAIEIVRHFGLRKKPRLAGPCPVELFKVLEDQIADISPDGQRMAAATAYQILSLAAGNPKNAGKPLELIAHCIELIHKNYSDPQFNVSRLSELLGIHRSSLCRLFTERKSISPIKYLQQVRVQKALSLLKESRLGIAEISTLCGFACPNYFHRVVHAITGESPGRFRKS
ncbi:MAG: hypothetical protein A2X49_02700 [Lentisphaerae bacterium GWF2_52_8]|nr:MAG: hypothetical protein A2X49_02700 [Lentisphaerae bacterium GWF2_52_8]